MGRLKTILLTGATGFLGSYLLERLLKENYNVIILKRSFSNIWRIKHLLDSTKYYDIDKIPLEKIFEENKVDIVIHLATYYKKSHNYKDIGMMIDSNLKFPTKILDLMRLYGTKYFINTGTFFEYELVDRYISENTSKSPYNLYASTKLAFGEILKYYSQNYNIKIIDLKLFAPYGPKDNENKLIPFLIKNFLKNKIIELSPSEQKWNWTYYKDVVEAYIRAIHYISNMNNNLESFNIGNDKTYTIKAIIEVLEDLTNKRNLVKYTKSYPKKEIFYVCCDNTKAKNYLGWIPKYDLYEGLKETYEYYKNKLRS